MAAKALAAKEGQELDRIWAWVAEAVRRARIKLGGLTGGQDQVVLADPTGGTTVPGVWVAGNVTDPFAGVIIAAAAGLTAAVAINTDLIADDTRLAVAVRRARGGPDV